MKSSHKRLDFAVAGTIVLGIAVISVFWWKLYGLRVLFPSAPVDVSISGEAGDFIGGTVGTIWALTAVILLYSTLRLQRQELAETRALLTQQNFEATFFRLLENQRGLVNEIRETFEYRFADGGHIVNSNELVSGRHFFERARIELRELTKFCQRARQGAVNPSGTDNVPLSFYSIRPQDIDDVPRYAYDHFFWKHHEQMGHYFRHLYNLLKFVDAEVMATDKRNPARESSESTLKKFQDRYLSAVHAQMSTSELFFLFYNGLRFEKAREIVDRFNMLENLTVQELIDPSHVKYYPKTKFKSRET